MGQDGIQHGLHVVTVLLGHAIGQVGVEVLGFELGDTGILGAHFTQQAFAVELGNEGTGGFAFRMDGTTGLTALWRSMLRLVSQQQSEMSCLVAQQQSFWLDTMSNVLRIPCTSLAWVAVSWAMVLSFCWS